MKRILLLSFLLFLLVPFAASAGSLLYDNVRIYGTWSSSEMWDDASSSWVNTPYVDLDGRVIDDLNNYPLNGVTQEMFCVSSKYWSPGQTYDLHTIDSSTSPPQGSSANFMAAVWIADHYTSYSYTYSPNPLTQDQRKGIAQRAIWELLGVAGWGFNNDDVDYLKADALLAGNVGTSNWLLARNVSSPQGQSFLVSVPEPATLLLLGTGLLGIAVVGRKKRFKK